MPFSRVPSQKQETGYSDQQWGNLSSTGDNDFLASSARYARADIGVSGGVGATTSSGPDAFSFPFGTVDEGQTT